MKKLFYILLIGLITSCQSEERQEKQFIESFSTLMKEKQVFIMGQLVNSKEACYEKKTPQKIKVVEAFYKQYMKAMNDSIHLDSLYTTAQNICIQEGFQFSSLTNRDSLYKFLELATYNHSVKDSLLTKLRLLDITEQLITKFSKQHQSYYNSYASHQEFEVLTTLNKSQFKVGDMLKLNMFFYANQFKHNKKDAPIIYIDEKEITSDTFSIIATCEDDKPCQKRLNYQIRSFLGRDTVINYYVNYTVLPKQ